MRGRGLKRIDANPIGDTVATAVKSEIHGRLWLVLRTPVELSVGHIAAFRQVVHGNNRPIQPLNGREIDLSQ